MIISILHYLGLFGLFAPALVIIFSQYAPTSILPFTEYAPSDFVFKMAIYGAIALACITPLLLIKQIKDEKIKNTENNNNLTFIAKIKYVLFFIISVLLGLALGYTAIIKGFYIAGNMLPSTAEAQYEITQLTVTEKITSTSTRDCEYTLNTDFKEKEIYKNFFTPTSVCVTEEVFNAVNTNEPLFFIGKNASNFGFLIESVATKSDIDAIKAETETETQDTDTDTENNSNEAENTEEIAE